MYSYCRYKQINYLHTLFLGFLEIVRYFPPVLVFSVIVATPVLWAVISNLPRFLRVDVYDDFAAAAVVAVDVAVDEDNDNVVDVDDIAVTADVLVVTHDRAAA